MWLDDKIQFLVMINKYDSHTNKQQIYKINGNAQLNSNVSG